MYEIGATDFYSLCTQNFKKIYTLYDIITYLKLPKKSWRLSHSSDDHYPVAASYYFDLPYFLAEGSSLMGFLQTDFFFFTSIYKQ